MKEKNKKILKGIGVGALALVGMVGLTGCANVKISQEKFDNLIQIAEKADDYMKESTRLTKEEVLNLCQTAYYNSYLQRCGYENVVVSGIYGGETMETMFYSGENVSMVITPSQNDFEVSYYDIELGKLIFANVSYDGENYECTYKYTSDSVDVSQYIRGDSEDVHPASLLLMYTLNENTLKTYQLLNTGNYSLLSVVKEDKNLEEDESKKYTQTTYIDFEITANGCLVSINIQQFIDLDCQITEEEWDSIKENHNFQGEINYSYDSVDAGLVEEFHQLIKASADTQNN